MSYNIVKNGELVNVSGPSGIVEGKPIYGERKQYDTNKKMPLAGQASLKYIIDRDGILTGSCHKKGQGYSAWMHMNGKSLTTFDNYGGEGCSFDFPSVRVKAGDVIELTSNVPTTETTNFFWLNNIGVTPIIGVEPGIELQAQDTYSLEEIKIGTWIDGKPIYRKVVITQTPSNTEGWQTKDTISSDIDTCTKFEGLFLAGANVWVPFPYGEANFQVNVNITNGAIKMYTPASAYCNKKAVITVEYTKNTD